MTEGNNIVASKGDLVMSQLFKSNLKHMFKVRFRTPRRWANKKQNIFILKKYGASCFLPSSKSSLSRNPGYL